MSRFLRILGSILITIGVCLFLTASALYVYGAYERERFEQSYEQGSHSQIAVVEETPSAGDPQPQLVNPTPTPYPWLPDRIRIPKIRVDSPVAESYIENGQWQIPAFAVGHLQGTAYPGGTGNAAFTGHLDGFDNSNVFARLKELVIGDSISLENAHNTLNYRVTEIKVVKRDDLSVVAQTPQPTLTLITCAGTWNPLDGEYAERLIVIAQPFNQ